jgi:uncharacterized protein (TIGR00369 family)
MTDAAEPDVAGSDAAETAAARRSKTFEWVDPARSLGELARLDGLSYMRAVADGTLPPPPMAVLINCGVVEVEPGRVVFTCEPGEEHYNPLGSVHGGLVCTLLDTVAGCATHTTLSAGTGYTSIEIKVNYLRAVTRDTGTLTAVGTVTKGGRRVVFADATVTDARGRLVATASSSLLVIGG